jgi:hypothetical protein
MVLLDGNVVDKHQMSIDAGRALPTVAAAILVSATPMQRLSSSRSV